MFSEVIVLEVLALVKKTHTPVSATSLPSVTNTLGFWLRTGCWATCWEGTEAAAAAAAETDIKHRNNKLHHHCYLDPTFSPGMTLMVLKCRVTRFSWLSVLIVEHEMGETFSHKELLHAVDL